MNTKITTPTQNYPLRDYQEIFIKQILEQWAHHRRVLAQLPTGAGKTVVFSQLAKEFVLRRQNVLVVAHREELIFQAAKKLLDVTSEEVGIIKAGYPATPSALVQVASVQSLAKRVKNYQTFDLVIIDEAHHAAAKSYLNLFEIFKEAYFLGVTATPIRLDGKGFTGIFDILVKGISVNKLIEQKYLSDYRYFAHQDPMSTQGVKTKQGDYSLKEIAEKNDCLELSGKLIENYQKIADGKQCVVFCVNVEHSKKFAEEYKKAGYAAVHLDGDSPAEDRKKILNKFAKKEITILCNCALFDEGLDIPSIEAIQIAKPTKSIGRYLQMVGRALRPAENKKYALILDHTDNWERLGMPDDERNWKLTGVSSEPKELKKYIQDKETGEVKENKEAAPIFEKNLQLQEVNRQKAIDLLRSQGRCDAAFEEAERNQYKPGWLFYRLCDLKAPLEYWQKYAKLRGYKQGWAKFRYEEQCLEENREQILGSEQPKLVQKVAQKNKEIPAFEQISLSSRHQTQLSIF